MRFLILAIFVFSISSSNATSYKCEPEFQTVFGSRVENNDFLKVFKPYTFVHSEASGSVERCSRSYTQNQHVCETYKVDRFENDANVQVKKYYVFTSQYDIQIFKDLSYIDNNGRGGMLYGKCKIINR